MITRHEREIARIQNDRFELAQAALTALVENRSAEMWPARGFELVADTASGITTDGREIIRVQCAAYALRPEVHAARLAAAFDAAKKAKQEPETKSVVGTDSLSAIVCPKCGDNLQHTTVCPKCAAGKLGYRHRYACVCGGADLISKDAL